MIFKIDKIIPPKITLEIKIGKIDSVAIVITETIEVMETIIIEVMDKEGFKVIKEINPNTN